MGADYLRFSWRDLRTLAVETDKQLWLKFARASFFANANIRPIEPTEMVPYNLRVRVSAAEVFSALDRARR
ncbi:MAG: hypothetical protein IIZ25_07475 [Thermoguttaceae bacterium]|nr:hypothetical protein [Thermoguttaceae bacterium]